MKVSNLIESITRGVFVDEEWTTINCKKKTKERFDKLGNLSMSQDDVLNALIDFWERHQKCVKQGP